MAQSEGHFDLGAQRLGALYAKAILAATESAGKTDAIVAELNSLVDDVLDANPGFEKVLASEVIPGGKKLEILDRVLRGRASPLLLNFLKVLAEHGRLGNLRAIRSQLTELYNELRGHVRVEVTTAVPLSGPNTGRLTEQVRAMLGREPQFVARTDANLIGGVLLRVGDTVFDGSVAAQLQRLRGEIRQRSLQEIQGNRAAYLGSNGV